MSLLQFLKQSEHTQVVAEFLEALHELTGTSQEMSHVG